MAPARQGRQETMGAMKIASKPVLAAGALLLLVGAALLLGWVPWRATDPHAGLVGGNGRIEATEIAVASKQPGRLRELLVSEGDFVKAGQVLARLQLDGLQAQRDEALARLQQARQAVATSQVQVAQALGNHQAVLAQVVQRETDLQMAQRRLPRTEQLARDGFLSDQALDDDRPARPRPGWTRPAPRFQPPSPMCRPWRRRCSALMWIWRRASSRPRAMAACSFSLHTPVKSWLGAPGC